ncbi:hypothetical protein T11_11587 [Trichinella zimbabwensis]|uniref:Uncharacterized protein n=1 Tax=Trichinella zimbabwensis TaxID=268475 RepID=A0A0V1HQT7_9BILA|nr:hypothetical protein T11_11587 [Trichinella zimbabwensis]
MLLRKGVSELLRNMNNEKNETLSTRRKTRTARSRTIEEKKDWAGILRKGELVIEFRLVTRYSCKANKRQGHA